MASLRLNLPNAFKQIARQCPSHASTLEEIERHLRKTIKGEHTLQEFAEHYCLVESALAE